MPWTQDQFLFHYLLNQPGNLRQILSVRHIFLRVSETGQRHTLSNIYDGANLQNSSNFLNMLDPLYIITFKQLKPTFSTVVKAREKESIQ